MQVRKWAIALSPVALATNALAALPAGTETAVTGAFTDGQTVLGLLAAGGAALFVVYKVLKRLGII